MSFVLKCLMGYDAGLASIVKVGDRVRHGNTGQWGEVLEVVLQRDDTAELRVQREKVNEHDFDGQGWWATYHVDGHRPASS